jgi:hypothetical protein
MRERKGLWMSGKDRGRLSREARLWQVRRTRVERVHTWRAPARARCGELLQWGTSEPNWLEGRSGKNPYLIAMIDDASSRALARFVRHDSTDENLRLLRSYLETYGRAFYIDKASLFQAAPKAAHHRDAPLLQPTQIGRALKELNIEWSAAHSPQAKGGMGAVGRNRRVLQPTPRLGRPPNESADTLNPPGSRFRGILSDRRH